MFVMNPVRNPTLFGDIVSPPVRFVMMTASALEIDLNFHKVDLFRGENKTEFYTKINRLQKVPALEIENEVILESNAIALYLCNRSKDRDLYPSEILPKARVDQMLFFNSGELFPLDSAIFSAFFANEWPIDATQVEKWNTLLDYLESVLVNSKWLAGEKMRLCDLSCAATISSLRLLIPPLKRHSKVNDWLENINALPFSHINAAGLKVLKTNVETVKDRLSGYDKLSIAK
ncbi:glutathione S-transferase 1-like isoform X2 [Pectinophora gossypiella]|uniref:glutathione S-transferase 1-like isoform X2 n=2 Tax=Pectinophora gossypiella TaxID=13191 RepID=UPI00214EAE48|nr:glutathione S-transferase 1-like isoform X2 [Pectinophora gossypiella]